MALNMLFKNQDSIMKCLRMRGYNNIEVEEALLTVIIMKRLLFRYFLLSVYFLPKKHRGHNSGANERKAHSYTNIIILLCLY